VVEMAQCLVAEIASLETFHVAAGLLPKTTLH